MSRFDLADLLNKTGFSLRKLASYLQVAPGYLEAALAGEARLTARDEAACRLLWRRLFKGKQLDLPFAESLETFTRNHARSLARDSRRAIRRAGERPSIPSYPLAPRVYRTPRRRAPAAARSVKGEAARPIRGGVGAPLCAPELRTRG